MFSRAKCHSSIKKKTSLPMATGVVAGRASVACECGSFLLLLTAAGMSHHGIWSSGVISKPGPCMF